MAPVSDLGVGDSRKEEGKAPICDGSGAGTGAQEGKGFTLTLTCGSGTQTGR